MNRSHVLRIPLITWLLFYWYHPFELCIANVLQFAIDRYILLKSEGVIMAKKTATVSARIDEEIKDEAEGILRQLGIPVSVVINTLYHQIINKKGIPFTLTLSDKDKETPHKGDEEHD